MKLQAWNKVFAFFGWCKTSERWTLAEEGLWRSWRHHLHCYWWKNVARKRATSFVSRYVAKRRRFEEICMTSWLMKPWWYGLFLWSGINICFISFTLDSCSGLDLSIACDWIIARGSCVVDACILGLHCCVLWFLLLVRVFWVCWCIHGGRLGFLVCGECYAKLTWKVSRRFASVG